MKFKLKSNVDIDIDNINILMLTRLAEGRVQLSWFLETRGENSFWHLSLGPRTLFACTSGKSFTVRLTQCVLASS
jgi:hypothetical protein